jgi:hypothetical protein
MKWEDKLKVLSVKSPYSYLIVNGIKDVENRTWQTKYRGELCIHSSGKDEWDLNDDFYPDSILKLCDKYWELIDSQKKEEAENYLNENVILKKIAHLDELIDLSISKKEIMFKSGLIIGKVNLVDIVKDSKSHFAQSGCYHWILDNPIIFDNPIIIKGKLGIWEN